MTKILERNVNVKIFDDRGPSLRVQGSLLDVEHSFHLELIVEVETGRILRACAEMIKRPYPTLCPPALKNVARLEGEVIGRGINRRIAELLGGASGCVHLVEVAQSAVRFTATYLIDRRTGMSEEGLSGLSEHEHRRRWLPLLKNTCHVFRVEEKEHASVPERSSPEEPRPPHV
ncbi:hypothetical protein HRbin08_00270 [bacterium HR08]|nr:hypothetical protein HRbin08_00270 [bacterium HR08]